LPNSTQNTHRPLSRLRRVALATALALLVGMALLWRAYTRNNLVASAVKLVSREHWVGLERRNGDIQNYDWLTDTDVLLYRKNADKTVSLLRKKVVPSGDETAATELPLPKLINPFGVTLSPEKDTLRILYEHLNAPRKQRMSSELISMRDGKRYGPVSGWVLGGYFAPRRAECECELDKKQLKVTLSTFDASKPQVIAITGMKEPGGTDEMVWPMLVGPDGTVVAHIDSYFSGIVTPADSLKLGNKLSRVISFLEFNFNHPEQPGKTWTVPVPEDAATFNCSLSPEHNHLLWEVQSNHMPIISRVAQHLPKALRPHPKYMARWMVSDLYGKNMHTIAEFNISDLYFNRPDLITPRWMPDGKHVSFEYGGALYMLDAR
jgi:hypothetical protein